MSCRACHLPACLPARPACLPARSAACLPAEHNAACLTAPDEVAHCHILCLRACAQSAIYHPCSRQSIPLAAGVLRCRYARCSSTWPLLWQPSECRCAWAAHTALQHSPVCRLWHVLLCCSTGPRLPHQSAVSLSASCFTLAPHPWLAVAAANEQLPSSPLSINLLLSHDPNCSR